MKRWIWTSIFLTAAAGIAAQKLTEPPSASTAEPVTLRSLYGLARPAELVPSRAALVLVDFQREFFDGRLPLPGARRALEHAARLTSLAREKGVLVVHVQNVVTGRGSPIFQAGTDSVELVPELRARPHELTLTKSAAGAFSRTNLDALLRARGIDTVIVAGLMTHLAVQITATDATVLGYRVIVASDATATRALPGAGGHRSVDAEALQAAALSAMADRVADVMQTEDIVRLRWIEPGP